MEDWMIHWLWTWSTPVLPIRSGFPDFGPDPDFLAKTGPEMVWFLQKNPDLKKNMCFNAYIYYIFSARLESIVFFPWSPSKRKFKYKYIPEAHFALYGSIEHS